MKTGIKTILMLVIVCNSAMAQKSIAKVEDNNKSEIKPSVSVNAAEEIRKIRAVYDKQPELSMDVTYKVFVNHIAAIPIETNKGHYKKRGEDFETNIEGLITLQNKNILLTADPETKHVYVASPAKVKSSLATLPLDTLLSLYTNSKITVLDPKNSRITLSFLTNSGLVEDHINPEYEKIDIYYNSSTYLIHKFVLFYALAMSADEEKMDKEKPRMEVVFSNLNFNPGFEKSSFSEKNFYEERNGKLKGLNDYKDYQVFDQRLKK